MKPILFALLSLAAIQIAVACEPLRDDNGRIVRSSWSRSQFRAAVPCPLTGETTGVKWQTKVDARVKDKIERKECGELEMS